MEALSTEVEIALTEASTLLNLNLSLTAGVRPVIGLQGNNRGKYMVFTLNSPVSLKPEGFECLKKKKKWFGHILLHPYQ